MACRVVVVEVKRDDSIRERMPRQDKAAVLDERPLQDNCAPKVYAMRWVALTQLCLINFGNSSQWIVFSIVIDQAKDFYSMSSFDVNLMAIIYEVVFCILTPVVMFLFDRYGARAGLRWASVLNAIGVALRFVAALWAPNFTWAFISQLMLSAAMAFVFPAPPVIAARWFGASERTLATTIGALSNSFGLAIGQIIPPLLITGNETNTRQRWAILFAVQGVYAVLESFLVFFVLPDGPPTPPSSAEDVKRPHGGAKRSPVKDASASQYSSLEDDGTIVRRQSSADTRRSSIVNQLGEETALWPEVAGMFRIPAYACLFATVGVFFGSQWGIIAFLPQLLKPFGVSEATVGWMGFLNIIVGICFAIPLGKVIDKYRVYKRPLVYVLTTCTCCYTALAGVLYVSPPGMVPLCFIIYSVLGIAQAFAIPLFVEYAVELTFPVEEAFSVTGIVWAGNAFAVPLMFGLPAVFGSSASKDSAVVAICCLAVAGFFATVLVAVPHGELKRYEYEQACREEQPGAAVQ
jgi:MFS family permease